MSSRTAPPPYEREPLLSNADVTTAARDAAATAAPPIDPASSSTDSGPPRSRILRIVIVGFFIHMAVDFSQSFISVGLNQLVEGAACQQLYPDVTEPYADDRCKNEDVQSKLTLVMGWEMTFTLLPGLITAIPWGLFADRYGARAFLFIAFLGQLGVNLAEMGVALNPDKFDVRYVWLCTLFNFIGGGPIGYEAMQYTVANSITTESNRATIFFYLTALQIINQLISGPLTYGAMKIGPKFTQSLAVGCLAVGTLLVLALPGDISTPKKKDDEDGTPSSLYKPSSIAKYASLIRRLFRNNVQLGFLMFSLLFTMVGSYESVIRLQYSTDRYGYTWGEAGLVSSTTTIVNLLLIGVLLPIVSKWLLQTRTAIGKDIWLARFGIGALIVGSFATGLAPTRTLFVIAVLIHRISSSYTPAIISLIASVAGIRHADDEHASLVYLAVAFMRSAGQLIAGPLLAAFFTIGLRWGGAWLGLPFVFAGFLQILAGLIVFSVKDRSRLARYDEEEEEEES